MTVATIDKIVSSLPLIVPFKRNVSDEEFPNKACKLMCEFAGVISSILEYSPVEQDGC